MLSDTGGGKKTQPDCNQQSEVILMFFQGHRQSKLIIWSYCNKKLQKCPYILLAFASLLSNRASSVMLKKRADEKMNDNPYDCCQQILIIERRFVRFAKTQNFTKKLRRPRCFHLVRQVS